MKRTGQPVLFDTKVCKKKLPVAGFLYVVIHSKKAGGKSCRLSVNILSILLKHAKI